MAALYSQNGAIVRQVASFTGEMKTCQYNANYRSKSS